MAAKKISQPVVGQDGSIVFNFSVTAAEVAKGYREVVQEYAATAEIKGFRKGKAPLDLVEKSLDKAKVYSHALEHILPHAYSEILTKHKLSPLIEPRITPVSMEEGKDWEFKAETAAKPEIQLGNYRQYVAQATQKALAEATKKAKKEENGKKTAEPSLENTKLTAALDALLANTKIEVAQLLIDEEAKTALSKLVNQLKSLKLSLEDYLKSIKKSQDELVKEYTTTAATNLKLEFILNAIAADLKPDVKETDAYKKYAAERKFALDFLTKL